MIGDIVGMPGRRIVHQQLDKLRQDYNPDLIIANAENASGGSGMTAQMYKKLISYGIDGLTLGDHVYRQKDLMPILAEADNVIRPANLPDSAIGSRYMKLTPKNGGPSLYVITVLGRIFMTSLQGDDPYATVDNIIRQIPEPNPLVLIEVHAEVTSEKVSMGHYFDGRAAAVVGTHTHIPTADAKILPKGTAYITDLGMTGPYDSVLGRDKKAVIKYMTTSMPHTFNVADGDPRMCGIYVQLNDAGKATKCERIEYKANMSKPPFG